MWVIHVDGRNRIKLLTDNAELSLHCLCVIHKCKTSFTNFSIKVLCEMNMQVLLLYMAYNLLSLLFLSLPILNIFVLSSSILFSSDFSPKAHLRLDDSGSSPLLAKTWSQQCKEPNRKGLKPFIQPWWINLFRNCQTSQLCPNLEEAFDDHEARYAKAAEELGIFYFIRPLLHFISFNPQQANAQVPHGMRDVPSGATYLLRLLPAGFSSSRCPSVACVLILSFL